MTDALAQPTKLSTVIDFISFVVILILTFRNIVAFPHIQGT